MSNLETDRTAGTGQTEAKRNPELVRMVVESSASHENLPNCQPVRERIITGMTEILVPVEIKSRNVGTLIESRLEHGKLIHWILLERY